jgi:hypothetical protein
MPKQSADNLDVNNISSINPDKGLVEGILDLNHNELVAVIVKIAN